MKKIILAGGCFWGMEAYFKRLKGVLKTTVGYIDGSIVNPSYQDVCNGSGHAEAIMLEYDENIISIHKIFEHFFRVINPTEINRQGFDFGKQYRSAIYYFDVYDKEIAIDYIKNIVSLKYNKPIQTKVLLASKFYPAEEYHQDYLGKNPNGYCHIDLKLIKKEELATDFLKFSS